VTPTPVLVALLMRVFWGEARWESAPDHVAIGSILVAKSERRGVTLQEVVRVEIDKWSHATDHHPWLLALGSDCTRPQGWSERKEWPEDKCLKLAARARMVLRGAARHPCPTATGWRAPQRQNPKALRRALRKGYQRVYCGRTVNVFLREPKR